MTRNAEAVPGSGFDLIRDPELLRVLAHPTRMRIYVATVHEPLSAKDLAERFEEPLPRVSYHMRALADAGLLRAVRRTQRRGAVETHYRAIATLDISEDVIASADPEIVAVFAQAMIREVADDMLDAVDRGAASAKDYVHARAYFHVTRAGRDRVLAELRAIYDRLRELEEELRREAAEQGGATEELNLALALYEGTRQTGRNSPFVMLAAPEGGGDLPVQIPPPEEPRG
ncbi:MAG TPA: metalloregulator ArsR/SmtB family transcription factor [Solirubrobacteraceae bacterium]|nr:metalloregulator ArsR/SmtB family transcription factor [Solirubrobacteraceae bacterium]